jgi:hypothetical protein
MAQAAEAAAPSRKERREIDFITDLLSFNGYFQSLLLQPMKLNLFLAALPITVSSCGRS